MKTPRSSIVLVIIALLLSSSVFFVRGSMLWVVAIVQFVLVLIALFIYRNAEYKHYVAIERP